MPKKHKLVLGLAGLGTVGGGVVKLLEMNKDWITRRTGVEVVLKTILGREHHRARVEAETNAAFTMDMQTLANDPEIDIVLELVGGTTFARDLITTALKAGKHVVTANKALLAEYGEELFPLAAANNVHLCFDASVAGGIPTVQTLKGGLISNRISKFMGILNGTANFILSNMSETGMSFDNALKLAQEKGYAEADPTLDIEGLDAAHKLVLLIQLAFGKHYPMDKLPIWGVSLVRPMDIAYAKEFGYKIKLIAQAQDINGKIEAGVFPALIDADSQLAAVEGSFNAILLEGNAGPIMLHGYGAGDLPTASAVLADVLSIAERPVPNNLGFQENVLPVAEIMDLDEAVSEHYLRFNVQDRPGLLRDVGSVMARHDISLAQVVQKGKDTGDGVPLVFLTHKTTARQIHAAMREAESLGLPTSPIMHYRIL